MNEIPGVDLPQERVEQWGRVPLAALVGNPETFLKHFDWVVAKLPESTPSPAPAGSSYFDVRWVGTSLAEN